MKEVGGFGDMLEDDLEKSHPDCERFRQQVAGLPCPTKQAESFSHYEKMSNHPQVQQAQQNTMECTKRPLQNGDKAEKAHKNQKLQRDVARTGNMTSMQLGGAAIPFNACAKTKQEKRVEEST